MRSRIRGLIWASLLALLPFVAQAGVFVGVSVNIAPPVLPVYVQPAIPAPGYLWTPGYWAWGPAGYYWVPGTWVLPPAVGLLWTPGYWGWVNGGYFWHAGYWGPHVGFYGGINYGCGYGGVGYGGGEWRGGQFFYNNSVNNVRNVNITNVYSRTVVNNVAVSRVSFNGGAGGVMARPTSAELAAGREQHVALTGAQRQQENLARNNESLRASVNGGHPPVAATARPGAFTGHGVVAARGATPGGGSEYHTGAPAPNGARHSPAPYHLPAPAPQAHAPQPMNRAPQEYHSPPAGHPGQPAYRAPPPSGHSTAGYPGPAPHATQGGYRAPAPQHAPQVASRGPAGPQGEVHGEHGRGARGR
ncbi:MAG: YXWGXW repeat-containing protein [Proteobacteria bacterium]|nr:YXWGXW repeat-containing protein [Pseudomonadota bacterium]